MTRRPYWSLFLLLLGLPGIVGALGLGRISVDSFLNEPLNARIELLSLQGIELEDLKVRLADAESFRKAGLARPFILTGLRFEVVGEDADRGYIRVTSRDSIKEPFLDFLVALEWDGNRMLRQFTILLDPPVVRPVARVRAPRPALAAAAPVTGATTGTAAEAKRRYGPVKRSDTLWVIARDTRPDRSVTVEQMMMALLRANPQAFRYGNVNFLKRGAILEIPDREALSALTPAQARRLFREQTQAWKVLRKGGRPTVANKTPPPAPATPRVPAAALVPPEDIAPIQRQQQAPAAPGEAAAGVPEEADSASLRVVEAGPEWAARQRLGTEETDTRDRRYPLQEQETLREAIADSRQNMEAVREINRNLEQLRSVLEGKIDSLRQSLEQRDRIIADLRQRLETMTAEAPVAAAAPAREVVPQPTPPKTAAAPPKATPVPPPQTGGVPLASRLTPPPAVEPAPVKSAPQGLQEELLGWVTTNWVSLALGLVALLLLLLLILSLRRRRRDSDPTLAGEAAFGSYVDLEEEMERQPETAPERRGDDTLQPDEEAEDYFIEAGADVASSLTEADIYLAYRRYSQAEALIKEAISANPESMVLKAKLLEIYAFRKDKRHFVPYMEEVYQAMAAEAPELWAKVVAMGGRLVPEHPLISAASAPDLLDSDLATEEEEIDLDTEIQLLDLELEEPEDEGKGR